MAGITEPLPYNERRKSHNLLAEKREMNTGMRFRCEKSERRLELKSEFTPYRKTAGSSEMGIADPVKSSCSKFVAPYHFIPGLEEKIIMKLQI